MNSGLYLVDQRLRIERKGLELAFVFAKDIVNMHINFTVKTFNSCSSQSPDDFSDSDSPHTITYIQTLPNLQDQNYYCLILRNLKMNHYPSIPESPGNTEGGVLLIAPDTPLTRPFSAPCLLIAFS